jgi:hypothetical protein
MTRLGLAGAALLAVVTAGFASPAASPPPAYKSSPPLVYKAKPRALPASINNNEFLFRRFLEWRKKQTP